MPRRKKTNPLDSLIEINKAQLKVLKSVERRLKKRP